MNLMSAICASGLDSNRAQHGACHLRQGAVVFPPQAWLTSSRRSTDAAPAGPPPNFLRDLLDQVPEAGVRFPTLPLIRVAGSTVPPALAEACMARLSPNLATVYGMVEIGFATIRGRVVPGIQVEVVDGQDTPQPAGVTGILRLRRWQPQEYFRNPVAKKKRTQRLVLPGRHRRIDANGPSTSWEGWMAKLNRRARSARPVERALQEHPSVVRRLRLRRDGGHGALSPLPRCGRGGGKGAISAHAAAGLAACSAGADFS